MGSGGCFVSNRIGYIVGNRLALLNLLHVGDMLITLLFWPVFYIFHNGRNRRVSLRLQGLLL